MNHCISLDHKKNLVVSYVAVNALVTWYNEGIMMHACRGGCYKKNVIPTFIMGQSINSPIPTPLIPPI
jgi:hypothetical protein